MCDTFVHKNPDETIFNQDTKKIRLILCSRGTFKSSVDRADVAQWIICFPNVRVVIFSASPDLGVDFVKSVKEWFTLQMKGPKEAPEPNCDPRYVEFQQLFPEHLISDKKRESEDQFLSPARTKSNPDPTLFTLPLVGNTAGHHADVGKFDDCVSDVNCGPNSTEDERRKVSENIRLKRKLIMLAGYKDYIGTPYASDDFYAQMLERNRPDVVLIKPCWEVKKESKHKSVDELKEADVNLLFPIDGKGEEQLTFKALKREANDDFFLFTCQFLCQPDVARTVKFTEQLINAHICQAEGLPQAGTYSCFSAWDFAGSNSASADFSVGCVGWFAKAGPLAGRMFVREIVMGRYSPSELAFQVAHQAARWRVEGISIEGSPGSFFLENEILDQLLRCGYPDAPRPEFFKVDTRKDAKNSRASNIETLLIHDRLWFSSDCMTDTDVLTKQFVNFKPHSKRKDDIVDGVAHLSRHMPTHIEIPKTEQDRQQAIRDIMRDKMLAEMLYPDQPAPLPEAPFEAPKTFDGYPVRANETEVYGT